jgi:hypothetical protein
MNWHTVLIAIGSIGTFGFLIIGFIILFSGIRNNHNRDHWQLAWYKKPAVLAGTGMILFALFVGLFVVSAASTDDVVKIVTISIGFVLFFPAAVFMLLGLSFFRMRSKND